MDIISTTKSVMVGPWGGSGGTSWNYSAKGSIKKIVITHGAAIDSLTFTNVDAGVILPSEKFGGDGARLSDTIDLDWPSEYLTSISGHYGILTGSTTAVITSLQFTTNLSTYGPFGEGDGTSFSLPTQRAVIVGFHGRVSDVVDAIGVYVEPIEGVM